MKSWEENMMMRTIRDIGEFGLDRGWGWDIFAWNQKSTVEVIRTRIVLCCRLGVDM